MKGNKLGNLICAGVLFGITVALLILKLTVLDFSWWIVFLPLWLPLVFGVVITLTVLAGYLITGRKKES